MKTVVVISGPTGPTGTIKGVNILANITGVTGEIAQWLQATGATGPSGLLEKVYNIGPTVLSGQHKNVTILGFTGSGGGASTLDPATKGAQTTLSNGNLTATHNVSTTDSGAFSTSSKTTGKWYLEATINNQDGGGDTGLGVSIAGNPFATIGASAANAAILFQSTNVWVNGVNKGAGGAGNLPTGHVIGMLLDMTNNTIQFNDITASLTGNVFALPALGPLLFVLNDNSGAGAVTVNFGASAFTASLPVGYTAWG